MASEYLKCETDEVININQLIKTDMTYKLIVTCKHWIDFQWAEDCKKRKYPCSFLVESSQKDSITTDEFLKQTGIKWISCIAKPYSIRNANGWEVKQMN